MSKHEPQKTVSNVYSCAGLNVFEYVHVFFLRMDSDLEERWPIQGWICKAKVGLGEHPFDTSTAKLLARSLGVSRGSPDGGGLTVYVLRSFYTLPDSHTVILSTVS